MLWNFQSIKCISWVCVPLNISSTAFVEPKNVMEFIWDLMNKDISRGLSDVNEIKVYPQASIQATNWLTLRSFQIRLSSK
jgi:hypothetical protein